MNVLLSLQHRFSQSTRRSLEPILHTVFPCMEILESRLKDTLKVLTDTDQLLLDSLIERTKELKMGLSQVFAHMDYANILVSTVKCLLFHLA